MGPAVLGRMLSTPTGAKWLSTGFKLNNAKYWAKMPPVVARILREAGQITQEQKQPTGQQLRGFGGKGF